MADPRYTVCSICKSKHPRPMWGEAQRVTEELSRLGRERLQIHAAPGSYMCQRAFLRITDPDSPFLHTLNELLKRKEEGEGAAVMVPTPPPDPEPRPVHDEPTVGFIGPPLQRAAGGLRLRVRVGRSNNLVLRSRQVQMKTIGAQKRLSTDSDAAAAKSDTEDEAEPPTKRPFVFKDVPVLSKLDFSGSAAVSPTISSAPSTPVTAASAPPCGQSSDHQSGGGGPEFFVVDVDRLVQLIDAKVAARTETVTRRCDMLEESCHSLRMSVDNFALEQSRLASAVTDLKPNESGRLAAMVRSATASLGEAVDILRTEMQSRSRLESVLSRVSFLRDQLQGAYAKAGVGDGQ
eukprot:m51a1_g2580 hypothetical protein (348) ;mRNA; r:393393-395085